MLSFHKEHHWSSLLAALVETDPATGGEVTLGGGQGKGLRVYREAVTGAERPDIVILDEEGRTLGVVEVKVLAALGPGQLDRYERSVPATERDGVVFMVVFCRRLASTCQPALDGAF